MKMADLVVEYWNDKGSELYNSYRFEDIKAFDYVLNREIGMDKVVNILDFGVGTGFISGVLLNEGYENITGIDINENMLDKASKNLKNTNVKLIQADGFHLPFQDETFDIIVSRWVLWVLPEPFEAIKEMERVLKKGGKIIAMDSVKEAEGIGKKGFSIKKITRKLYHDYVNFKVGGDRKRSKKFRSKASKFLKDYSISEYVDMFNKVSLNTTCKEEEYLGNIKSDFLSSRYEFFIINGRKSGVSSDNTKVIPMERLACPLDKTPLTEINDNIYLCAECKKEYLKKEDILNLMVDTKYLR